jgi:hypothetical protein
MMELNIRDDFPPDLLIQAEPRTNGQREKRIADKVAIITGASTHMGLATAKRFVQEGMDHVFMTGRRKDALGWSGNSGRRREPERP